MLTLRKALQFGGLLKAFKAFKSVPTKFSVFCLLAASCSPLVADVIDNKHTESWKNIKNYGAMPFRESPYASPQGLYPIDEALTKTLKHFRFVYDHKGRLASLSFRLGENLVTPMWYVEPNYYAVPETRFKYENHTMRLQFYDQQGRRALNGDVYEAVYRLDKLGNPTSLLFFGVGDIPTENEIGAAKYEWEIAKDGAVIERRYNLEGLMVPARDIYDYEVLRLSYRPDGLLAMAQSLDKDTLRLKSMGDSEAVQSRFTYNAFGAFSKFELLDADGRRVVGPFGLAADIATYTQYGQAKGAHFEDPSGKKMALPWGPYIRIGEYDIHGNRVSDRFFDQNMNPVNANFGVHEIRMMFDTQGLNHTATELFDLNGEAANFDGRGYSKTTYKYDELGRLLRTAHFDLKGNPVERTDTGVSITVVEYDDKALTSTTRNLNLKGNLTKNELTGWASQTIVYNESGGIVSIVRN